MSEEAPGAGRPAPPPGATATDATSGGVSGRAAAVLGIGLHVLLLPAFLASGLVAPPWAVVLLCVSWLGLLVAAVRLRHMAAAVLLVPVAALALLVGAVTAGEAWLGWTA